MAMAAQPREWAHEMQSSSQRLFSIVTVDRGLDGPASDDAVSNRKACATSHSPVDTCIVRR